jgi:hypothetical protein
MNFRVERMKGSLSVMAECFLADKSIRDKNYKQDKSQTSTK